MFYTSHVRKSIDEEVYKINVNYYTMREWNDTDQANYAAVRALAVGLFVRQDYLHSITCSGMSYDIIHGNSYGFGRVVSMRKTCQLNKLRFLQSHIDKDRNCSW